MNPYSLDRLETFLKRHKLVAALLSNPNSLTWLTGYAPPIRTGTNPFEGGPALAWYINGQVVLIMSDNEATAGNATKANVQDYVSYTVEEPIAGMQNQAKSLSQVLALSSKLKGKIGLEYNTLPATLLATAQKELPFVTFQPMDGAIDQLRAVKSAPEIERIQAALALCNLSQVETKKLIQSGKTEMEIWGAIQAKLEIAAGTHLPILEDFIAGKRTAEIGGFPGNYVLQKADPIISDVMLRLDGYWGDITGTYFVSEDPSELNKVFKVVLSTLRKGIEAVKPGVKACDLDNLLRSAIREAGYPPHPHHSGHGIGTSYHEEPRLVPYNQLKLEPDMVVTLEPGIYLPDVGGVRLEVVVLVTVNGCEVLTKHLENA
jgi:Xaa-Pro dipeptidase